MGRLTWDQVWSLQRRLIYEVSGEVQPQITVLCCEHPELITVGRRGSRSHIRLSDESLRRERLAVRWVGRGGGCLLHAPGQLCVYPILSLPSQGWTVGEYLSRLQAGVCAALGELNIHPLLHEDRFGIWGRSGLLAAVGVAVRNWTTCHGAFLNVNPSPARRSWLDAVVPDDAPSGHKAAFGSLLAEHRLAVRMTRVRSVLIPSLAEAFSCVRYHIQTGHPLLPRRNESSGESVARAC
jgi:lipoyl(octanoyl) transferase